MSANPVFRVTRSYNSYVREGAWLSVKNRIWVLIALGVAFFVRVNELGTQSLWNDEGTSVALAQTSVSAIVNAAARDIHPPLYYLLLNGWVQVAGTSEFAVRFLSVFAGVLVVVLTFRIAREFFDQDVAVIAAVLAALNPFQVYYAQETRMYIWVTLFACVSVWAMVVMLKPPREDVPPLQQRIRKRSLFLVVYILATLAALYTNYYAFTLVLFENLAFLAWLIWSWRAKRPRIGHAIAFWIAAQAFIAVAYLPWLNFARQSLTSWPGISEPMSLVEMGWRVVSAFVTGSDVLHDWQWLLVAAYLLFFVGGLLPSRDLFRQSPWGIVTCALWAIVPFLAMFFVSLSRPAYNPKFLLLATPGFLIVVARGVSVFYPGLFLRERASYASLSGPLGERLGRQGLNILKLFIGGLFAAGTLLALQNMYSDPLMQRANYRGMVNYINAVATERDALIVNAPGQLDVVRYYYSSPAQLVGLPIGRPVDQDATRAALYGLADRENVYGLFWATEQADPNRIVERYFAETSYKASDDWHGDVRLTQYTSAAGAGVILIENGARFGGEIELESYMYPAPPRVVEGFVPIELEWRPLKTPPNARYKVFAHLVDETGIPVSQRDTEPQDGFFPTSQWTRDETIVDRLAIPIPPGLPPGEYGLIVGLYRGDTGERLLVSDSRDYFELGKVQVGRRILPREALVDARRLDAVWGNLEWLGYEFGDGVRFPLKQGDALPLVLYLRARGEGDASSSIRVELRDQGNNVVSAAEAFAKYPPSKWGAGEIARDVVVLHLGLDALSGEYRIVATNGTDELELAKVQLR